MELQGPSFLGSLSPPWPLGRPPWGPRPASLLYGVALVSAREPGWLRWLASRDRTQRAGTKWQLSHEWSQSSFQGCPGDL